VEKRILKTSRNSNRINRNSNKEEDVKKEEEQEEQEEISRIEVGRQLKVV
jgi:hypothetical protein